MNRLMIMVIMILCCWLLVVSCSNNKDSIEENHTDVKAVTFTFYGNYDWMSNGTFGETPSTQWIVDHKKVKIEPINSGGAAAAKLNTMIASNTLPDVIQTDRGATVERLRAGNILVTLDEYYDKYPNLRKFVGEATLNMLRSEDGHIYQVPNWYTTTPNGNGGWFVNSKIYEQLGSPQLETFEDLYMYLTKIKLNYPEVTPLEIGNDGRGIGDIFAGVANDNPKVYYE